MISVALITASALSPGFMFRSSTASRDMSAVMVAGVLISSLTLAIMSPLSTVLTVPLSLFRALIFNVAATQYSVSCRTSPTYASARLYSLSRFSPSFVSLAPPLPLVLPLCVVTTGCVRFFCSLAM